MKIMMIANDTNFVYNLRFEILIELITQKHEVIVVSQILNYKEKFDNNSIKLINVNMERRGTSVVSDLKLFLSYNSIIKREKPDLVFTNNIKPNVYAGFICKKMGIKYIPNITGLGTALENPGKLQKLTKTLYKRGISGAKAIFFQNEDNLLFFKKTNMLPSDIKVIMLPGSGVNLKKYPVFDYPPEGMDYFLYVARIMRQKGIDIFLEVAKRFKIEGLKAEFHVCGACDDEQYMEVLYNYQNQGIITYHGLQKDISPFYKRCTCFLYPSYYPEGMSNVVLEACACGRPVIVADRPGCREPVINGINGYVVKVNDLTDTYKAAKAFLNLSYTDKKAMGDGGREIIKKEYDRTIVINHYLSIIEAMS